MKSKHWKFRIMAAFLVLAIVLTGCQPVGGLDLNKAFLNGLDVQSMEGRTEVSLHFDVDSATMTDEQKTLLALVKDMKFSLDSVKMQDQQTMSLKGTFTYGRGSIPFQMYLADNKYYIQVEGLSKTLVYDPIAAIASTSGETEADVLARIEAVQESTQEQIQVLTRKIAGYAITNLPNPMDVKLEQVQRTINNEQLSLSKVSASVSGEEMPKLFVGFLKNVLADEQGLNQFLDELIDFVLLIQENIESTMTAEEKEQLSSQGPLGMLKEDRETAAMLLRTMVRGALQEMVNNASELDASQLTFLKAMNVKASIYYDSNLLERASEYEMTITPPEGIETGGLKTFRIAINNEVWNMNKPVQADVIDSSRGQLVMSSDLSAREVLGQFDPSSVAYKLLKEDLKVNRQMVVLFMNDEYSDGTTKPYIVEGNTYVPARFVSEQLKAEVTWNDEAKQATISDKFLGIDMILTIGSKTALVNGKAVEMEAEAQIKEGTTFVPVRFIAEQLGGTVDWDGDLGMITIVRE
ncbi:copper amine oxidase N-terminal domain-containing protein [Paenibacillus sp. y28]|uniref:copper amine oxidase N-terminal domain-containing protein n=1 Tax=Paenibacillus sp. y28 TaxID=3129110 RepID=UPI0030180186